MESFSISPMKSRWSVLTDNTDIDEPRRKSWWKNLNENSQDFMEVLEDNKATDSNNSVEEISDIEIISQEDKNYSSLDLPESSDNESIQSIKLTERQLFKQKENKSQRKFDQLISARDTLTKLHKSNTTFHDKTITAGTKELFQGTRKSKPAFSALLNISANKTTLDKTTENVVAEPKVPVKNIFGNRPAKKRKNIFADFIVSDSEHEVSDIQVQSKQSLLKRIKNDKALEDQADEGKKQEISLNLEEMVRKKYNVSQDVGEVVDNKRGDLRCVNQDIKNQNSNSESADDKENESKQNDDLTNKSTAKQKQMDYIYNTGLEFDNDDKASRRSDTESNASLKLTYESEGQQEIDENIDADKSIVTDGVSEQDYQEEMEVDNCDNTKLEFSNDNKISAKSDNEPKKSLELVNKSIVHQELDECVDTNKVIEANEVSEQVGHGQVDEMAVDENEENTGVVKQKSNLIVNYETVENEVNNECEESVIIGNDQNEESSLNNGQPEETEVDDNENETNTEHEESEVDKDQNEVDNDRLEENKEGDDENEDDGCEVDNDENQESEVVNDEIEIDAEFEESQLDNSENEEELDNDEIEAEAKCEKSQSDNGECEEKKLEGEIVVDAKFKESQLGNGENEENEVDSDNNEENELDNDENKEIESDSDESEENEVHNEENEDNETDNDANEEEVECEESEVDYDEDEADNDENVVDAQSEVENDQIRENAEDSDENEDTGVGDDENEVDDENGESNEDDDDNKEKEVQSRVISSDEVIEESPNVTHDTTGRNRTKIKSPELVLHDKTKQQISFISKGRNTSIRETNTMYKDLNIKPSLAPPRDSLGLSAGDSSADGSGWDSHRTTRKTLRQTFGKDFTPRKSLRALVMEKSAKQSENVQTIQSETVLLPQANSTEYPQDSHSEVDVTMESDHEISRRTRQTTLETYLQKMKQKNLEKNLKMEEAIRNSLKAPPTRDTMSLFKVPSKPPPRRPQPTSNKPKKQLKSILFDELPSEVIEDMKYKPPKRFQPSNASWITKRLYKFLEGKLESKYDYKARVRAEKLVETIYHFAKDLRRHTVAPVDAVDVLKHELARLEVVKTHFEFYEFFHEFMPREVRVKVVPDIVNKIPLPRHGVFADILRGTTVQR
ncbi:unnamed protein product [Arctia plantaginis]|uniref:Uncharacterized protein n=1 Tax=Arctia plantaginis TaxID=874455 RepID=A0A8S1BLY3_ARCPL|nr:unnamed protein product [Arctia plantaginis]